jgi:hypothetical protein
MLRRKRCKDGKADKLLLIMLAVLVVAGAQMAGGRTLYAVGGRAGIKRHRQLHLGLLPKLQVTLKPIESLNRLEKMGTRQINFAQK